MSHQPFKQSRRSVLKLGAAGLCSSGLTLPCLSTSWGQQASQPLGRLLIFYFPDGVPGVSERGEASLWNCQGGERSFTLSECLQPLARHQAQCLFLNGLTMGPTDSGSHPGGAKKLLTGVDGGAGRSVDQHLSRSRLGDQTPFRHLYLGAQATVGQPSSDRYISYPEAGLSVAPQDDPIRAFSDLFGAQAVGSQEGHGLTSGQGADLSVLNGLMTEINAVRRDAPQALRDRLDQQLDATREVEQRLQALASMGSREDQSDRCINPSVSVDLTSTPSYLFDPAMFPSILKAQREVMTLAFACGLTRVGVIQSSHHTSELIMSRFPNTPFSDPAFDMRSHQASHYGAGHDRNRREFVDFVHQRIWFVEQFAQVLDDLSRIPEGEGTMLDYTVALLCTEVSDGNRHQHDDMPFVLAGGQRLGLSTGRLLHLNGQRHSDLLASICHILGDPVDGYGQQSSGPISSLWG